MRIPARLRILILAAFILALRASQLGAAQYSGSVRAADQPVPGAMVTAKQGDAKVIAYTDESGRYSMDLRPGSWDISIEMFEFTTATGRVTMGDAASSREWALEMPKLREREGGADGPENSDQATAGAMAAATAAQQAGAQAGGGRGGRGGGRGARGGGFGGGRGGFGGRGGPNARGAAGASGASGATGATGAQAAVAPGRGFQNAQIRAAQAAPQPVQQTAAAPEQTAPDQTAISTLDDNAGDEAFLVNGSTSGGLAQSAMDEATRQRILAGRGQGGAPGGPGGGAGGGASAALDSSALANTLGMPAGMESPTNDTLGLGGFGAAAINGGFGIGAAGQGDAGNGGFAPGAGGGRGGGGGGRGGGGGGGGAGGGRGGGRGGGGRANANPARGAFGGQFNTIGNRRRNPYKPTATLSWNGTNSVLNAQPYSLNGTASQKPSAMTNSYAATLGGPLVIPHLVKWPRSQYSISYSGTDNLNGIDSLSEVPTAALLSGDFNNLPGGKVTTIYDPTTNQPFTNNIIPQSRISPTAMALLQYFPTPTYTGVTQNFRLVANTPSKSQSIGVRLNTPLSNKDRLNFNIQFQSQNSYALSNFGEFQDPSTGSGLSASIGWSHSFKPRINNNATVTFSRSLSDKVPYFANKTNIAATLGIGGTTQDPLAYGPPNIGFTNYSGIGDGTALTSRPRTMSATDAFTYVIGRKHNLTFGYTYQRQEFNTLSYAGTRGSFNFSGLLTSQLANGDINSPVAGTGYDFADFLLGLPASTSVTVGATNRYFRQHNMSMYAQDDFRISPGTTLTVGLRYEYFSPDTELRGDLANIVLNPDMTQVAIVTPGMTNPFTGDKLPSSLIRPDKEAFSPRLALAYRPWQKHSVVTRFGYSIFYSGSAYQQIANQMSTQPPFANSQKFQTQGISDPLTFQNGFFNGTETAFDTYAIDPNYRLAYAQTWNATIQETLWWGVLLETEYIGTKGTRLGMVEEPNRTFTGVLPVSNYAAQFTYQNSDGNSTFNAGQVRVTKRLTGGLAATLLYQYSRGFDDASSFSGPGGTVVQYTNNFYLERGLSAWSQPHNLSTTFQYTSPVGVRGRFRNTKWYTTWMRGWATNGAFNLVSGVPMTATVSGNLSNLGGGGSIGGTLRAQATGLPIYAPGGSYQYFNPLAFSVPLPGEFGDAAKNTIPGLARASFDLSFRRTFRIGDEASQRTLAFQLNTRNALNHPSISSVGTNVSNSVFGLATGAAQMRTVSMSMRFTF